MYNVAHEVIMPNFYRVTLGSLSLWFSYKTCVAFRAGDRQYIIRNAWGPTTGKHLNHINSDKAVRLSHEDFAAELSKIKTPSTQA